MESLMGRQQDLARLLATLIKSRCSPQHGGPALLEEFRAHPVEDGPDGGPMGDSPPGRQSWPTLRCGVTTNPGSSLDFALTFLYGKSDTVYGNHTRDRGKR